MIADRQPAASHDREVIRVCFVIDRLSRAGTESQLLLLLKRLDRQKIQPYLCLLDGLDETSAALLPTDCPTLRLGVRRLASAHGLRQAWKFWRFLKSNHIDVVQTYFLDSTRFAAPIAKAAGVRAVFGSRRNIGHWMTKRDARINRFYNRWFIDKIIANCEAARQSVIQSEQAPPEDVIIIPNDLDLDRFNGIPIWSPKPTNVARKVGMVANLREVKGPDLFIRAAKIVGAEFPGTQFAIAGKGDQTPYQDLIDELGLANHVKLLGEVIDIPGFLATLDIAVLPSRAEGLSNVLLEYMAAGRPIVATDVGANAQILGNRAAEFCTAAVDAPSLAQGISRLLNDTQLASTLALDARAHLVSSAASTNFLELCQAACRRGN